MFCECVVSSVQLVTDPGRELIGSETSVLEQRGNTLLTDRRRTEISKRN